MPMGDSKGKITNYGAVGKDKRLIRRLRDGRIDEFGYSAKGTIEKIIRYSHYKNKSNMVREVKIFQPYKS